MTPTAEEKSWLEELCTACGRPLGDHLINDDSGMPLCPEADTRFTHATGGSGLGTDRREKP